MRKFIVGDIHGCFDELIELTEKVALKEEDMLISLGDLVDRGNKSKEVYEFLRNRPNTIVLMGNHERKHQNKKLSYSQEIVKIQFENDYDTFLKWIDGLEYYYETDEAIIVHAFFEHDKELKEQRQEVLCGSTSGDKYLEKKYPADKHWTDFYSGIKPIIYGHHVVGDSPQIINNTYGIDTGACHGNYLTAIELPGFIIHQVKAKKDYWKEQQKLWQIPVLKAKNWERMEFLEIEKQLSKLSYIEDNEIRAYLDEIANWKNELLCSFTRIKSEIDLLTQRILAEQQEEFNNKASKYYFKSYIFKSKSNTLTIEDLKKGLNSPAKILEIKKQLNIA